MRQQLRQPDGVFVGGAAGVGGGAPLRRSSCRRRCTAKRVLVLPCSMASSIGQAPPKKHVAGRYALRRTIRRGPARRPSSSALARPAGEAAAHQFVAQLRRRPRAPADRPVASHWRARSAAKPSAPPGVEPRVERRGRALQRRRDRAGERGAAVAHLGRLGRGADSRRCRRPATAGRRRRDRASTRMPTALPPWTSTSLGHFSRSARPAGRCRPGRAASAATKRQLRRLGRRAVRGRQEGRRRGCRAGEARRGRAGRARRSARGGDPDAGPPSPASARRRGLGVGGVELVVGFDRRDAVRQDGREGHGKAAWRRPRRRVEPAAAPRARRGRRTAPAQGRRRGWRRRRLVGRRLGGRRTTSP